MWYPVLLLVAVVAVTWLMAIAKPAVGQRVSQQAATWTPVEQLVAVGIALGGLVLRLRGLGDSLDLDEFGTLWAVGSDFSTAVERSIDFHGQSPVYYVLAWAFLKVLGESEAVIRLPSLLATAVAAVVVYRTGLLVHGRRAGLLAATVFWLSPIAVRMATGARPYGLAFLFASIALYGFIRAAGDGRPASRTWFVAGGVGLIAAHYLWALTLLGMGAAYLVTPALRRSYTWGRFSFDVAAMALLGSPLISQVLSLWGRRGELLWVSAINYNQLLVPFLPIAVLVLGGLAAGAFRSWRTHLEGSFNLLILAAVAQPVTLLAMAYGGTNLFVSRYIAGGLVAACVLAGVALAVVPTGLTYVSWLGWTGATGLMLLLTVFGGTDWRAATAEIGRQLRNDRSAPVLFRSGFIEDDQRAYGRQVSTALLSPLRSPGQKQPAWNLVPLTYNWDLAGREEYLERVIPSAIKGHDVFYYLSCECGAGPPSRNYARRLTAWIAERFGNRFRAEPLGAGAGMILIRFEAGD